MTRRVHISTSIEGLLTFHNKKGSLAGLLVDEETGRTLSDAEARTALKKCLARGEKFIAATGCDNFDPMTGCKGHDIQEMTDK